MIEHWSLPQVPGDTFFVIDMVESPRFTVGISKLPLADPDTNISGLGEYIAISSCRSLSKSSGDNQLHVHNCRI